MLDSWKSRPLGAVKAAPKLTQVDEINEELKKVKDHSLCI